ncbi:FtsK/SpoIIIE domain-containing protein [Monashia sp. NPDC004114]
MQLRLTVLDPADPANASLEIAVEAPIDTPFGRIRPQLESFTHASTFWADGRPLKDTALLGREPLVRGVTIRAGGAPDSSAPAASTGVVELSVVGGHGAGRTFQLRRGDHVVGRATSASVCLDDPGVSRAHAVISVGPDAVAIRDLEPTNRSSLDDDLVPEAGAILKSSSRLRVGSTTLSLATEPRDAGHHRVADGRIQVHRPPRFTQQPAPVEIRFPREPPRPDASRAPMLAALAPLVLSAGLALALSSPAMLLFALVSPVLLLGQWWSDRRAGRSSYRRLMRDHRQELETARAAVRSAVLAEARQRRSEQPDLAAGTAAVRCRTAELWQRRPGDADFLVLRIGTARQRARIMIDGAPEEPVPDVDDVPIAVDLPRAGVLGLAGQREAVLSMVGAMIAQLAAWHSPRDVHLRVLAASRCNAQDWTWAAYLPHAASSDGGTAEVPAPGERTFADAITHLAAQVAARQDGSATMTHIPDRTVLVLDGAGELSATPALAELLAGGPAAGILVLCIDRQRDALPTQAAAVVELAGSGATALLRTQEHAVEGIIPDLPTTSWLHGFARLAAPLVDPTPRVGTAAMPDVVSFRELHAESGLDVTTCDGIIASWASSQGRSSALVGRTGDGPHEIDLVRDGPHALVGGTTGAGKSELLRALVAGLAVRSRPDDLTFVLVDYKGGSAFGECAALPHVLGVVTDLDEALTRRALTSLDAELRRRERLLARAGASDYAEYADAPDVCRSRPRLARLVIVVDEFKMLSDELPDFVSGLVRIATVGRSLGLHLVLATQRPAGAVSADMRANVALRIALRMRDGADSSDVIEAPDAASIGDRAPGRALVRGGDGRLVALQTAYVSGRFDAGGTIGDAPVRVRVVGQCGPAPDGEPRPAPDGERRPARDGEHRSYPHPAGTELGAVVRAAREAADKIGVTIPESPWLPALPDVIGADHLPSADGWAVPLGLADDPAQQRQVVHAWDLDHGSLGLAGGPRTGRSTALVSIALRLAGRYAVDDLHIHVLQGSPGPCTALARLPHAGAVVDGSDPALVRRVVQRLASDEGDTNARRRTLVLVDGWDALEHSVSTIDHGVALEELYHLVRDGGRSGLRFAITGGRSML